MQTLPQDKIQEVPPADISVTVKHQDTPGEANAHQQDVYCIGNISIHLWQQVCTAWLIPHSETIISQCEMNIAQCEMNISHCGIRTPCALCGECQGVSEFVELCKYNVPNRPDASERCRFRPYLWTGLYDIAGTKDGTGQLICIKSCMYAYCSIIVSTFAPA